MVQGPEDISRRMSGDVSGGSAGYSEGAKVPEFAKILDAPAEGPVDPQVAADRARALEMGHQLADRLSPEVIAEINLGDTADRMYRAWRAEGAATDPPRE